MSRLHATSSAWRLESGQIVNRHAIQRPSVRAFRLLSPMQNFPTEPSPSVTGHALPLTSQTQSFRCRTDLFLPSFLSHFSPLPPAIMATTTEENTFKSLYIHTHDVSRSLKPSADGELAHAIHQTLHFALDGHPDDYTPSTSNGGAASGCDPLATMPSSSVSGSGEVKKGFFPTGDESRPYISYHWEPKSRTLALPNPATISNPIADPCSTDERGSYDVTAKFFFLDPTDLGAELVDGALKRLTNTTGIITIDTLVLAFPTLALDSPSPSSSSWLTQVSEVWSHISQNPQLFSLGLSDISHPNLETLLSSLNPPIQPPSTPLFSPSIPLSTTSANPSASSAINESSDVPSQNTMPSASGPGWNLEYSLPSPARRPRLISINVKQDPCSFDRDFSHYCSQMGIQLVAHSDRKDVLPQHTLPGLMEEFKDKLPKEAGGRMRPKWALKYTTLIRDRGVLADKGYIVFVETE